MNKYNNPLNNVKIASPCSADWNAMIGDDRKRFCGQCSLNVYNLSEMSKAAAEELLMNSEGRLCVRLYRRTDGTVISQDCPVGWKAAKQRISKVAAAVVSLIIGLFTSLGMTFAYNRMTASNKEYTMGDVAYPTPRKSATPSPSPIALMGAIAPMQPKNTPKPTPDNAEMGKFAISRN